MVLHKRHSSAGKADLSKTSASRPTLLFVSVVLLWAVGLAVFPPPGYAVESNGAEVCFPVLLLNGAVYPEGGGYGALPPAFALEGYPAGITAWYVVQCEGPLREEWLEELEGMGAEIRGYLPYHALLVGLSSEDLKAVREKEFVRWAGLYQPYYKLSPALQLRLVQGGEAEILVELFSRDLAGETLEALQELPVEVLGVEADEWCAVLAVKAPLEAVDEIAALPAVEWLELAASGSLPGVELPVTTEVAGVVDAAGIVSPWEGTAALGDTGLGVGGREGVPESLRGVLKGLFSLRGDDGKDFGGHGTAVAGVLAGGLGEGRAVEEAVSLLVYATEYGLASPPRPLSLYRLLREAESAGARVWLSGSVPEGRESLGAYGIYASQRDAFVRRYPDMIIVEAAGNEGTDADGDGRVDPGNLLGGATAKNVVSVGGCESRGGGTKAPAYGEMEEMFHGDFHTSPLAEDACVGDGGGMAAFSSRGPTRDGRIKPDLVAPSTWVLTLASGGEENLACLLPSSRQGLVRAFGTSFAAAEVARRVVETAGMVERETGKHPSAALCKALLVNGAEDLHPGQYGEEEAEIPPAPNPVEGWGRMDFAAVCKAGSRLKMVDEREGLYGGEAWSCRVSVEPGKELRVTLAWTDFPSLPEARLHLVNDLDLTVRGPGGETWYPNGRNTRDPLNNVERTVIPASAEGGEYLVEVNAWNVPFAPQPFALVVQVF